MSQFNDRTERLLGTKAMEHLTKMRVLVFGIGGVGGHVVEAFTRTGIGTIGIVDCDVVDITNINRQIIALQSTLGRPKTEVMESRMRDINPSIRVIAFPVRLTQETLPLFRLADWDYIVDAIDDVKAKLLLIEESKELGVPIISSMGTGNKLNPSKLQVTEIGKTHTCPLAKAVRKELGKRGIKDLKVVFSPEEPRRGGGQEEGTHFPSSIAFVPAVAGLLIAGEVVNDFIRDLL